MNRTPFFIARKIQLMIDWYGTTYVFKRNVVNSYNEPTGSLSSVQNIPGIYHAQERSFVELISVDGASIKSKVNKGILCNKDQEILIQQNDLVMINNTPFHVVTVEPVIYGEEPIAYEISLEEVIEGADE